MSDESSEEVPSAVFQSRRAKVSFIHSSSGLRGNIEVMRDSRTLPRNSVGPMNNGSGLYSTTTGGSSHDVSDAQASRNPISESSTAVSRAAMGSGLHDNLYLHPEVHNPVHHNHRRGTEARVHKSNGHTYVNGATSLFGQATIEVTADELISDGIAARRLFSLFWPFVFLMTCLGLYHPSSEDVTPERDSCFAGGWCGRWLLMAWSAVLGLFLLFNIAAIAYYVDVLPGLDVLNVTEILIVLRLLKGLVVVFFFFLIFETNDRYEEMLETWCIWLRWQTERNMSHSRRWIFIMTCLTVAYSTVPSVLMALSVFGYIPHMGLEFTAFATDDPSENLFNWHYTLRITFTIAMCIANLMIGLSAGFFSSICIVLQYEMRLLAREIQVEVRGQAAIWDMKIEPHSGQEVTVMEFLRRKHGKIAAVVRTVDHSFREVLFLQYLFGIPVIIFEIYLLFTAAPIGYVGYKGTILLLMVTGLWELVSVWLAAVKVHSWAHQPANILPTIDIHEKKEITHAHQTSLGLFLSSLTTQKIALTLWGVVPLTKYFIIMVAIFVVTYLIILVDLSPTHRHNFIFRPTIPLGSMETTIGGPSIITSPVPVTTSAGLNASTGDWHNATAANLTGLLLSYLDPGYANLTFWQQPLNLTYLASNSSNLTISTNRGTASVAVTGGLPIS